MAATVNVLPILPERLDRWRDFIRELAGPRAAEFAAFNRRYGLTDHRAWLMMTPEGQHQAVVLADGPGAADFIPRMAQSSDPFDSWFLDRIVEVHAIDLQSEALAPPPELYLDWRA
jgi:hypothetical protein